MNTASNKTIGPALASFSAAIAVIFLALAAHALKEKLEPEKVHAITTAGQIQLFHAIALIALYSGNFAMKEKLVLAGRLIFSGSLIFSFSIYLLATIPLSGLDFLRFLGPVTPIGGLLMIAGWILAGMSYLKNSGR